jgi:hypothetical protein
VNFESAQKWTQLGRCKKKRLIYIAGEAHSGSTAADYLLGRFLGRSCGQLVDLGQMLNPDGSLNEDAAREAKLDVWQQFLQQAPQKTRDKFRWIFMEVVRERNFLSYSLLAGKRRTLANRFDESITSVYEYFGCDALVDSSKNITRALGLQKSEVCDVYVVHLIRSPADFLTSIAKRSPRGRTVWSQLFWISHWSIKNALAALLRVYFGKRYFLVDYKSVFLQPRETLAPLFRELGIEPSEIDFPRTLDENRFEPETLGGNRIRTQGPIALRYVQVSDEELSVIHPAARLLCRMLEPLVATARRPAES